MKPTTTAKLRDRIFNHFALYGNATSGGREEARTLLRDIDTFLATEPPNKHPAQIVNRFEVIDHRRNSDQVGRRLVIRTDESFMITESRQDGGRTLKILLD